MKTCPERTKEFFQGYMDLVSEGLRVMWPAISVFPVTTENLLIVCGSLFLEEVTWTSAGLSWLEIPAAAFPVPLHIYDVESITFPFLYVLCHPEVKVFLM